MRKHTNGFCTTILNAMTFSLGRDRWSAISICKSTFQSIVFSTQGYWCRSGADVSGQSTELFGPDHCAVLCLRLKLSLPNTTCVWKSDLIPFCFGPGLLTSDTRPTLKPMWIYARFMFMTTLSKSLHTSTIQFHAFIVSMHVSLHLSQIIENTSQTDYIYAPNNCAKITMQGEQITNLLGWLNYHNISSNGNTVICAISNSIALISNKERHNFISLLFYIISELSAQGQPRFIAV